MIKNNIVTYTTVVGGALLVLTSLFGLCFPHLLRLQLVTPILLVHLASGLTALFLGLKCSSLAAVRMFCFGVGTFYCLVGLIGLAGMAVGGLGASLINISVGGGFLVAAAIQALPSTIYSPR